MRGNHRLHLNAQQLNAYLLLTGPFTVLPHTAEEFNAALEAQAGILDASGSPDERLAAMLARELQIR